MARRQQESQRGRAQRLALYLLAIWSSVAVAHGVRPSEHGLANQKDPGPASPPMVAFFHARPVAALPEAQNVAWTLVPPGPQGRRRPRSELVDGAGREAILEPEARLTEGLCVVGPALERLLRQEVLLAARAQAPLYLPAGVVFSNTRHFAASSNKQKTIKIFFPPVNHKGFGG
ncbi:uncharacterized protein LOC122053114 [Zingiber officinale]|uniref:uncharacterized protein LOC122053114 n=1 Tax=Zingiber officinale TaxID=94328 RepID=UPI001C4AF404|nr:uncharacterized protein LOC122053114 [Zingiber officinale]